MYNNLEKQKDSIFEEGLKLHKNTYENLKELINNKNIQMEKFEDLENQKIKNEKNHIDEEKERLRINKTHIDLDIKVILFYYKLKLFFKHIDEENKQIADNIEIQTKEYKIEETTLKEKKQGS